MTYKLDISEENKLVTVTPDGEYSTKNIKDLIYIVIKNQNYDPKFNLLIDIRDVKYIPVTSEIFEISEFIVSFRKYFKGKTAIVAHGELLYNMFRLSAMFLSKYGLKSNIFLDPREALAWIVDPDTLKEH